MKIRIRREIYRPVKTKFDGLLVTVGIIVSIAYLGVILFVLGV